MPLLWLVSVALAHQPGISFARVDAGEVELRFAERDLGAVGDPSEVAAGLLAETSLTVGGQPCALGAPQTTRVEGDGVDVRASFSCPHPGQLVLDAAYLQRFPEGHRHMVEAGGAQVAMLDPAHRVVPLSVGAGASSLVPLGVEHILTGWDHLAFVAALVLGASSRLEVLALATTFTVAHSITLGLAVTGALRLPSEVVEPLIAASIVWVAVENRWPPPVWRRRGLTFLFGLVHGLGFAGVLAEVGVPQGSLLRSLFSFNAGVELGQVAAIAVMMLGLAAIDGQRWRVRARGAASVALAAMGLMWFVARVTGA